MGGLFLKPLVLCTAGIFGAIVSRYLLQNEALGWVLNKVVKEGNTEVISS